MQNCCSIDIWEGFKYISVDVSFSAVKICSKIFQRFLLRATTYLWASATLTKGSSIKYVRRIFQKTNISNPLIGTRTCAYQGIRNVSFSENFAHVLNGWHQRQYNLKKDSLTKFCFDCMSLQHISHKLTTCWNLT